MADITICKGEGCTMKQTCHRYKATPDEYGQSYFASIPCQGVDANGETKCSYYYNQTFESDESTR